MNGDTTQCPSLDGRISQLDCDHQWQAGRLHVVAQPGQLDEVKRQLDAISPTLARDAVVTERQPEPRANCPECGGDPSWRYRGALFETRCSQCFPGEVAAEYEARGLERHAEDVTVRVDGRLRKALSAEVERMFKRVLDAMPVLPEPTETTNDVWSIPQSARVPSAPPPSVLTAKSYSLSIMPNKCLGVDPSEFEVSLAGRTQGPDGMWRWEGE